MKLKIISALSVVALLQSCATYKYADKVKLVSFDDSIHKGKSVGPIRGEDCTWTVLGIQLGSLPTVDKAFINARNRAGTMESAGFKDSKKSKDSLRYVNNVSTENAGFNAGIVRKQCIAVTGVGYL